MPLLYETLHNHTSLSDGEESHLAMLATAEANNFGVVAFTDHDILPDDATLRVLNAYEGPVTWSIGCEISSGLPSEMGGGPASMFHIVGLFVDPHNHALLEHCRLATEARRTRMEQMVANLRGLGFTISVDDCLEASSGETVGRPHILAALLAHPENAAIIEELKTQLLRASHTDPEAQKLYEAMRKAKYSHAAYWLFLSKDSFIKNIYVDYLYWADMDKSVRLIREAGGIAQLAHWWTIREKISLEQVSEYIRTGRLDGIEVASGFSDTNATGYEKAMKILGDELGCPQTIGIDTHHQADFAAFVHDKPEVAQATIGQTAQLLGSTARQQ